MDFILLLKARKRELKKNLAVQKERMQLCFSEIRSFIDFYEKQVDRVITDQFTRFTDDIKKQITESKLKAAYLEEEGNQLTNKAKIMSKCE
jgi:hypothetical protein